MGNIMSPGICFAFANQKGGVGKSTLTSFFAGYLHTEGKKQGFKIAVIDADDKQRTLARMREREVEDSNVSYKIMTIPSSEVADRLDFIKEEYDIILIDLPGNMLQTGVFQLYHFIDVVIVPTEASILDIDSTILFYEEYKKIIKNRKELGFKTSFYGVFNKVNSLLIEFKQLNNNRDQLPFEFLDNYIRESRVQFQRNITTLENNNEEENVRLLCEEILKKIINHISE